MVYRGVLDSSEGEEVEVAVKTLKEGSGEEDSVKFLQEAAIIGQFKHHSVVTMYGVHGHSRRTCEFCCTSFTCGK